MHIKWWFLFMDRQVIVKQYFSEIEEGNGTPLYLQLQRAVKELIAELPDNSLFPSERELADDLKINRRTLRKALEPFIAEGRLLRSQRGTVVRHYPKPSAQREEQVHPFTLDMAAPVFWFKTKPRVLLYETLPFQQKFWQEAAGLFRRETRIELEICYPQSPSQDMAESYWQEFSKGDFDLAHLPVSYNWKDNIGDVLSTIPDELRAHEASAEFASETIAQTVPELLQYGVPFAFSPRLYCWNRHYVESLKLDIRKQSIEEILEKAQALPEGVPVASNFYDLCLDLGVPEHFSLKEVQAQLKIILRRLRLALSRPEPVFYPCPLSHMYQRAVPGNVLVHGQYSSMLRIKEKDRSGYLFSPATVRRGGLLWGGSSALGISRQGSHNEDALRFLEFMLSEKIQHKVASELLMAPFRRAEWPTLAETLQMDPENLAASLASCRENPKVYPPPVGLVLMRFQEIMSGKATDAEATKLVLQYYEDSLSKYRR